MAEQALPQTGDPFARAYAHNGGAVPPRQPAPYAGYGIQLPSGGATCPPSSTEEALVECVRAVQELLKGTLQLTDLAPWINPPFRSRTQPQHARAVIVVPAAVDAAVNAAGLALAAAGFTPVQVLEVATGTGATVFEIQPNASECAFVKSWGVSVQGHDPDAVRVIVSGGTTGGVPTPPSPFLSSHEVDRQQPANLLVQPNQKVKVQVANLDPNAPVLVHFGIVMWTFPVRKRIDSREDVAALLGGYGVDCR